MLQKTNYRFAFFCTGHLDTAIPTWSSFKKYFLIPVTLGCNVDFCGSLFVDSFWISFKLKTG